MRVWWSKPTSSAIAPFPDWKIHGTPEPKPKGLRPAVPAPAASATAAPSTSGQSAEARVRRRAAKTCVLDMAILLTGAARVCRRVGRARTPARRGELRGAERGVRGRADPAPGLDHEAPAAGP